MKNQKAIEVLDKIKKNLDYAAEHNCVDKLYNGSWKNAFSEMKEKAMSEIRVFGIDVISDCSLLSDKLMLKLKTKADEIIANSEEIKSVIDSGNVDGLNDALDVCRRKWYDCYISETQKAKSKAPSSENKAKAS